MKYAVYTLQFSTGVHFGNGMLNDSDPTFRADTLFSALYIEAIKCGKEEELLKTVQDGNLLFSDAFPYVKNNYMVPKPICFVQDTKNSSLDEKKLYKQLKYIPIDQIETFLSGQMDIQKNLMKDFGKWCQHTKNSVRTGKETMPFFVGTYYYNKENGLYIIVSYRTEDDLQMAEELLDAVSCIGIGGKRTSGLGKFVLKRKKADAVMKAMERRGKTYILLNSALPREEELESAMKEATYLLEKRSGFVASDTYAEQEQRKKDLYVFAAGSCFQHTFSGDVFDVSSGGKHAVYRYAKPLFMEV